MRHIGSHPIDCGFTDPVCNIFTILFSRCGSEMDNQARLLAYHHSGSITTGDIVGANPNCKHAIPKRWWEFPERGVEAALLAALLGLITSPGIIHEKIESALLAVNAVEDFAHLGVIGMITAHSNPRPPAS